MAIIGILGEFLQIEASDKTIIKLQGAIVRIMMKIKTKWDQYTKGRIRSQRYTVKTLRHYTEPWTR